MMRRKLGEWTSIDGGPERKAKPKENAASENPKRSKIIRRAGPEAVENQTRESRFEPQDTKA